jgi:hypothetical protein
VESGCISAHILTLALDGGEWLASSLGCFMPGERAPGIHGIGGWVGSRAGLSPVMREINCPWKYRNPAAGSPAHGLLNGLHMYVKLLYRMSFM